MKVIRQQNQLFFQNFERRNEREIFDEVAELLRQQDFLSLSKEKMLPYCDMIEGKYNGQSFTLAYDLDYGTDITCHDKGTLKKLEDILAD